jgi:hypothetical protein
MAYHWQQQHLQHRRWQQQQHQRQQQQRQRQQQRRRRRRRRRRRSPEVVGGHVLGGVGLAVEAMLQPHQQRPVPLRQVPRIHSLAHMPPRLGALAANVEEEGAGGAVAARRAVQGVGPVALPARRPRRLRQCVLARVCACDGWNGLRAVAHVRRDARHACTRQSGALACALRHAGAWPRSDAPERQGCRGQCVRGAPDLPLSQSCRRPRR